MQQGGAGQAGTATVLFTDLVGSTALRQALGDDRADNLRRQHDRMLRDAVAAHGGVEVKGTGDGLMVVFNASAEAVAAAVEMQQAVARFNRRAEAPLGIRVGVSAGDVVWEDGDCFGTPVVEARRLCDAAESNAILVSEVVRLLAGSRGGHHFVAVEPMQLKGLAEPVRAAEVEWAPDHGGTVPLPPQLSTAEALNFVGREHERERLAAAWKAASSGAGRIVLVSGEPGVGKTRLAAELASSAQDDGATVLFGRCDEDLGVPYQPFVEAFDAYVNATPANDLAEQAGAYGGDLARLVPALAAKVADLPDPLRAEPATERYRLFEAVRTFLTAMASSGPVVFVLDDLHWADKPTLLLLRHLVRTDDKVPMLVVATYRDTDLGRGHPLSEVLADLRRERDVERLDLVGLDEREVGALIQTAAGQPLDADTSELARAVHAETEGNPFFVGQVLRHLVESNAVVQRDGRWVRGPEADRIGIPEGVREVIGRRLGALTDQTNEVLATAAVIGREFDAELLVAAGNVDEERVYDALEQAEQARLLLPVRSRPGRYTFAHALVRSTLYEEISTTRRLRLHRRVGQALEGRGADRHVDVLAHHFCECAGLGDIERAVNYGRRAAGFALERLAYEEAAGWYERVLAALDPDDVDHAVRAGLNVELGQARWSSGDRDMAKKAFADAMASARVIGDAELFARAAVLSGGRRAWMEAGVVDGDLIAVLEEALSMLPDGDSAIRAMANARLASELYFRTDAHERRMRLTEDALAMARRVGDLPALAFVLNCARFGIWIPGNVDARVDIGREIMRIAGTLHDTFLEFSGTAWLVCDLWELGDAEGFRAAIGRLQEIHDVLRMPETAWITTVFEGCLALFEGRVDDAQRLMDEALAYGQRAQSATALQFYGVQLFAVRRFLGGLEDLEPMFVAMVEEYPLVPAWRCGLVYLYAELGWVDKAREQFDILRGNDFQLPFDANWAVGMAILGFAAGRLDEKEAGRVLYDRMAPYADAVITIGMPADVIGPLHLPLGVLSATLDDWDAFDRHVSAATDWLVGARGLSWLPTARLYFARALLRGSREDAVERARPLLDDAAAASRELGLSRLQGLVADLLTQVD